MSHYIECNTIAATQAFLDPLWYKEHLYAVTNNTTVGTLFRLVGHFLRRYYYNGFTGDYHRGIHPLKLIKWSFVATKFTPAINNSWQVENIWRWNFGIKSSAIVNVCLLRKDWAHYTTTMYVASPLCAPTTRTTSLLVVAVQSFSCISCGVTDAVQILDSRLLNWKRQLSLQTFPLILTSSTPACAFLVFVFIFGALVHRSFWQLDSAGNPDHPDVRSIIKVAKSNSPTAVWRILLVTTCILTYHIYHSISIVLLIAQVVVDFVLWTLQPWTLYSYVKCLCQGGWISNFAKDLVIQQQECKNIPLINFSKVENDTCHENRLETYYPKFGKALVQSSVKWWWWCGPSAV